ncbi:DUF3558 domain-containing protein [Amycolatopsis thermophila]|uniref:DUF3558 domain-containing protein n=1 Tax=Amycolatopsis thermophila TaxID=206084 RepID=A0ABU0ET46_9PSEU|nr:DUF3558 domain-containing protein [Amycolatopsis thermophila]MDQ0378085.1 hypothetical protein [Amycolatopsis thermophila]
MEKQARTAGAFAGIACIASLLTGCTSMVTGTASPATTTNATTEADAFAGLKACQLLEQLNAGQGFNPGENKTRRNECGALKPGFASYSLVLDPVQGLEEFAATNTGVVNTSINGRDAMQADIPTGGCAVAIKVAEHARAMALVTMVRASEDAQACPNARALAERVEPLLPKTR